MDFAIVYAEEIIVSIKYKIMYYIQLFLCNVLYGSGLDDFWGSFQINILSFRVSFSTLAI